MQFSEIKTSQDALGIITDFVDTETLLYRSKNKELTLRDSQWYKRLGELKNYVKEVKLPERKEYLRESKDSGFSSHSFFIKKYTELGGAVSYSYTLLKNYKKILGRLSRKGDLEVLKYFVESLDKDVKDNYSEEVKKIRDTIMDNSLFESSKGGHLEIVRYLVEKNNANPDEALFYLARGGFLETIKYLVKLGARSFKEILRGASEGGHFEIVQYAIEQGAVNFIEALRAASRGGYFEIVKYLIHYRNDDNALDWILHSAAKGGHFKIVEWSIDQGAGDFAFGLEGASDGGHFEIVKFLVEKGIDEFGMSLFNAANGGYFEIFKYLIEQGASDFDEVLGRAAGSGYLEIVKFLVERGIGDFEEALKEASAGGHFEIVKYLVKLGAKNFESSLVEAAYGGRFEIVKYLSNFLIKQDFSDFDVALKQAVQGGHLGIAKYFISLGAKNLDILWYAVTSDDIEIVKYLIEQNNKKDNRVINITGSLLEAVKRGNLEIYLYLKDLFKI